MACSPISILKGSLKLNCMHVKSCEFETIIVQKDKERFKKDQIIVHARPFRRLQSKCPKCGRKCCGYDTKYPDVETTWRAPSLNGVPVLIRYTPHRIECPEHGVLTENIPWADGNSHFTESFTNEVAWLAMHMNKTAVTTLMDINWRTVGKCIKAAWERIEPDVTVRMRDLKRICVDETSYKRGHKYITVVYDMDRNRVVWVHDGHGFEVFEKFCLLLPKEERDKIEIIAGDGARWIDTCTKRYFPNATRCIDFFHVVEWANSALDKVRASTAAKANREYEAIKEQFRKEEADEAAAFEALRKQYENACKELAAMPRRGRPSNRRHELEAFIKEYEQTIQYSWIDLPRKGRPRKERFSLEHQQILDEYDDKVKEIKYSKHALGHRPDKCTDAQHEKIKLIENSYPDLYRAYQLKEALRLILHMRDCDLAEVELDNWIRDAAECGLKAIRELSEKIARHRNNILNSVRLQANSAKSESANTTIKAMIKTARGFRNIDTLIAFIYLKCSDLVIPLNNRYQPTAERSAEKRARDNDLRRKRDEARQGAYESSQSA